MAEKNTKNIFDTLNAIDVSCKTKTKNGLTYLPWASAWGEVKKRYPDATYKVIPQIMDDYGNTRFWHDDGKTGWVEVCVTINGLETSETLAIMDLRNNAIPAESITSTNANKAVKRCLVKALALHGMSLYIYEGEDLPEESSKVLELRENIDVLVKAKLKLSDAAKEKVIKICKEAEKEANPELTDDLISGNYKNIDDVEALTNLEKRLMAIRK